MKSDVNQQTVESSFARLEERIRQVTDLCRDLRVERILMQKEIAGLLLQIETLSDEKRKLERRIDHLVTDRLELRQRVEDILDAVATLEIEAESVNK
ncbi:MAG: hypothetical protein ACK562_06790 [Acidobacteriota bacterium]|jgi:hypothetical protein